MATRQNKRATSLKNDQRLSIFFLFKTWLFCSYIVYIVYRYGQKLYALIPA